MLEFTKTTPTATVIWNKLVKTEIPSSDYDDDLIRTMMLILLRLGINFPATRDSINKVLDGTTPIPKFIRDFRNALLHRKSGPSVDIEITEYELPVESCVEYLRTYGTPATPYFICRSIMSDADEITVASIMDGIFSISNTALLAELQSTDITAYKVSLPSTNEIFEEDFRKYFKPYDDSTEPDRVYVKSLDDLKLFLRKQLVQTLAAESSDYVTLPHFIFEGDTCEA